MKKFYPNALLSVLSSIIVLFLLSVEVYALEIPNVDTKNAQKIVYGDSGKGRELSAYKMGNGNNVLFAIFELHGYEDAWNIVQSLSGWYKISFNSSYGYVSSQYVLKR